MFCATNEVARVRVKVGREPVYLRGCGCHTSDFVVGNDGVCRAL